MAETMKPATINQGQILLTRPGGCTTPQATDYLEVMFVFGDCGDGTIDIIGRATGAADDGYRPFAMYGDGIRLKVQPELCELVTWRKWVDR